MIKLFPPNFFYFLLEPNIPIVFILWFSRYLGRMFLKLARSSWRIQPQNCPEINVLLFGLECLEGPKTLESLKGPRSQVITAKNTFLRSKFHWSDGEVGSVRLSFCNFMIGAFNLILLYFALWSFNIEFNNSPVVSPMFIRNNINTVIIFHETENFTLRLAFDTICPHR